MKLKLEADGEITILVISEAMDSKQIPVLKAGLKKLVETNKKTLLLDFTAVPGTSFQADPLLVSEVAQLQKFGQSLGALLAVTCGMPGTEGLPNRTAAVEYLRNPLARLLATENGLNQELKAAEELKAEIQKKLQSNAADIAQGKKLKNENTALKKEIQALEELIQRQLAKRTKPLEPVGSLKQKSEAVKSLLLTVLEQEGAIAPRS